MKLGFWPTWVLVFGLLVLAFIYVSMNWWFTAWPEMQVYPYLMGNGFNLYSDLLVPYTPLFLWKLTLIDKVFGYSVMTNRVLVAILFFANCLIIWQFARVVWKKKIVGLIGMGVYFLWFFYLDGNGLWFELAISPFYLLAIYFFYNFCFETKNKWYLITSFVLASLCFFMKQSSWWLLGFMVLWLVALGWREKKIQVKYFLWFGMVFLLIFALTCLVTLMQGSLNEYLFWAYKYTFLILPFNSDYQSNPDINELLRVGIMFSILGFGFLKKIGNFKLFFLISFLAPAVMFVFPRWGLFHFQVALPLFAVLAGGIIYLTWQVKKLWVKVILVGLLLLWVLIVVRQGVRFWGKGVRFYEPGIYRMADKMRSLNKYVVFNSYDQVYQLSGILPATKPYVQNFASFMEVPGVQERVIRALEKNKTKYILFSPYSGKGMEAGEYRPAKLGDYLDKNYIRDGNFGGGAYLLIRK